MTYSKLSRVCLCTACALLVHCLCIACVSAKKATEDTKIEEQFEEVRDTSHLEIVTQLVDSVHYVHTETERVRVVERYDPQTGVLTERLTDSERQTERLQDLVQVQGQRIAELESALYQMQRTEGETHTEKERESSPPLWVICLSFSLCAAIVGFVAKRL